MGMMLNRRRAYGGKKGLLPSGYKQLEYIENTSNAYIDTDVIPNSDIEISISFLIKSVPETNWAFIIGGNNNMYYGRGGVAISKRQDGYLYCHYGDKDNKSNLAVANNTWYNIMANFYYNNRYYVKAYNNGLEILNGAVSQSMHTPIYPLTMFTCNNLSTGTEWRLWGCISSCTIKKDDTLVRNFIPCKNPNNVVGMYDTVNDQFYSSPNGTTFIAGPEV